MASRGLGGGLELLGSSTSGESDLTAPRELSWAVRAPPSLCPSGLIVHTSVSRGGGFLKAGAASQAQAPRQIGLQQVFRVQPALQIAEPGDRLLAVDATE